MSELDPRLVSLVAPGSVEAEQYRKLRNAVEHVAKAGEAYVVAISSPVAGDGKTVTAINLAGSLAQAEGRRVLLIDADFRASPLQRRLDLSAQLGLADAIVSGASLRDVRVIAQSFNLAVVLAGSADSSPYEMLSSPRFRELIAEARHDYDFVVIDTPPLLSVSDCRLIADLVDSFVLVVAAHRTPRGPVEEALRVLDRAKILGFVLNAADTPVLGYPYPYV
jgi:capsular exopolysaccharide synthesis family protein